MKWKWSQCRRDDTKWSDLDYMDGARLLALNRSEEWCNKSPLKRILPWRRHSSGTRPGPRGAGPLGKEVGDVEQWVFPQVVLTEEEKVGILGAVVRLLVEILFANHIYTFGGKWFATAAVLGKVALFENFG